LPEEERNLLSVTKMIENWFCFEVQDIPGRPSRKHNLHLKDNDGGYCPENVEWLTARGRGAPFSTV
jgi:hypothetical protein